MVAEGRQAGVGGACQAARTLLVRSKSRSTTEGKTVHPLTKGDIE